LLKLKIFPSFRARKIIFIFSMQTNYNTNLILNVFRFLTWLRFCASRRWSRPIFAAFGASQRKPPHIFAEVSSGTRHVSVSGASQTKSPRSRRQAATKWPAALLATKEGIKKLLASERLNAKKIIFQR